jgi:hypothetical protein
MSQPAWRPEISPGLGRMAATSEQPASPHLSNQPLIPRYANCRNRRSARPVRAARATRHRRRSHRMKRLMSRCGPSRPISHRDAAFGVKRSGSRSRTRCFGRKKVDASKPWGWSCAALRAPCSISRTPYMNCALADEIDPPIALRQGIAVAQYINGKRIAAKFMGAPSPPLYAVGGVEDRSSLRLPWRLLATRFARILKAGRIAQVYGYHGGCWGQDSLEFSRLGGRAGHR